MMLAPPLYLLFTNGHAAFPRVAHLCIICYYPAMPAFRLAADYEPAGDQPGAIAQLNQGLERGDQFQVLLGVTGSGKTYTMANIIEKANKPTLILTHNKTLAAQLYQEFKSFFPDNAVEYFVSYYDYYQPEAYVVQTDTFIEKDASINDEIEKLRLRATANLLTRRDTIIVASVSCIYGLGSPEVFREMSLRVQLGETRDRDDILRALVKIQYDRNDYSLDRGTFRVRGDVIEVHPSYDDTGLRIELFGDEVERLTRFHLITGETIESLDALIVAPAKHFVTRDDSRKRIVHDIADELHEREAWFQAQNKLLELQRISSRTRYDMEMILETGMCSGIENYSRIVEDRAPGSRPFTLLDYFGDDWLMFIDESHVSVPQVGGMYEGDKSRKTTLIDYGFRLPCAIDNRPMKFTEFETIMPKGVVFVSATPGDYELRKSGGSVVELINRPTGLLDPVIQLHPVHGQMDHLLAAIEETVSKGDRVLVTTLTKKMSQDLTDYFQGVGVRAQYLHSEITTMDRHKLLKGLRKGEFDVLVGINLLREGLDLPEVSLVAILDADKEGFLRNFRSLIQTMGRASRNLNGHVILYADRVTDSMAKAIAETERRRTTQIAFNEANGIVPRSTTRRIEDDLEDRDPLHELTSLDDSTTDHDSTGHSNPKPPTLANTSTEDLETLMMEAAARLDFEEAARLRDLLRSK